MSEKKTFKLWDYEKREPFEVVATKQGKQWMAICPKHNDTKPSLSINEDEKIYNCFGCGWKGRFYNPDYKYKKKENIIMNIYDYEDENEKLLFQVVKYYPKKFVQRRPGGKEGWIWDLDGVRRVLYKLPSLIKGSDPVFIVEGEKDVDNVIKLGLTATTNPMGAGKWKPEYNEFLKDRSVVLIPDNHKEGFEHAEQVGKSLLNVAKNIKYLELPGLKEKEDISDWIRKGGTKEELLELVKHARQYNPYITVYQDKGTYIKKQKGEISNFIINPLVRVQTDEGEFLKSEIITNLKKTYPIQFSPDDLNSKNKFKKALRGYLDLQFFGSDDDIQHIKGILASYKPQIKRGIKTTGVHKVDGSWVYVEEGLACDSNGNRDDITYISMNPYKTNLLKETALTSEQLDEMLSFLCGFNDPDVVFPILGFCFACFVKERIFDITNQNPILVCWGEKGSGKTETLSQIIKPLFGIRSDIENIGHPTEFGLARIISSSNLPPILFDEYKTNKFSDSQKKIISEMLRSVYNQTRLTRGTPDLRIVEFVYSAPVILAGEMGISELAIKDRIIETYFSKKETIKYTEEFNNLKNLPLGSLGKDFLQWTLKIPDNEIKKIWQTQFENVDEALKYRLRQNTAYARLGLKLFLNYLQNRGINIKPFEIGFNKIDQSQKKNILEESNKTIVDTIIEAFSIMAEKGTIEKNKHYMIDINKNLLYLHISSLYPEFKKWAKDYQWDGEILNTNSFTKQIKENKYFIENKSCRLGKIVKWVICLDITKMNHLEIESFVNELETTM